jgi:hypothetical protein
MFHAFDINTATGTVGTEVAVGFTAQHCVLNATLYLDDYADKHGGLPGIDSSREIAIVHMELHPDLVFRIERLGSIDVDRFGHRSVNVPGLRAQA